jgi:uncharacterized membrane protein YdjX (TVP38/TMEM64 family)
VDLKRSARDLIGALPWIVLIALIVVLWRGPFTQVLTDADLLQERISQWGAWGPGALIALQVAQTVLAPIPGHVLSLASGYLFGAFWGSLYSIVGTAIGSTAAFVLARTFGRPLVERFAPSNSLERLDTGIRERGLVVLVLVFLAPFLPDDVACFAAGLTTVPIPVLILAVLAGRAPGLILMAWLGSSATELAPWQWAAALGVSVLLVLLFVRRGNELETRLMQAVGRWSSRTQGQSAEDQS